MAHATWILLPDAHTQPDGPLQLGTILSSPKDLDSIVLCGPPPDPNLVSTYKETGYHYSEWRKLSKQSSLLSIFLDTTLGSQGAHSQEKLENFEMQCDVLDTIQFIPSVQYVVACLQSEEARAWIKSHNSRRPLYLVTGIQIAQGARIRRESTEGGSSSLGVQGNIHPTFQSGVPVELLSSPLGTTAVSGLSSATFSENFVFAYRLRKLNIKEAKSLLRNQPPENPQHSNIPQALGVPAPASRPAEEREIRTFTVPGEKGEENSLHIQEEDVDAEELDRPLRILSLDGGGVRGISSLLLLQDVMNEIADEEKEKTQKEAERLHHAEEVTEAQKEETSTPIRPCDYFDLICGTSTGGLIAIMLGRLGLTVDDCILKYRAMAEEIFSSKSTQPDVLYDAGILEQSVEKVLQSVGLNRDTMLSNMDSPSGCRTFVVATATLENGAIPFLLRSYKADAEIPAPFKCTILEACRATSAAPSFFAPMNIHGTMFGEKTELQNGQPLRIPDNASSRDNTHLSLSDGGLTANNPTFEALFEIEKIPGWGRRLAAVVSIGTGKGTPPKLNRSRGLPYKIFRMVSKWHALRLDVAKYCADLVTDTEATHVSVLNGLRTLGIQDVYHRLNVPEVGEFEMDKWQKMPEMERLTMAYVQNNSEHRKTKKTLAKFLRDPEYGRDQMLNSRYGYSWVIPTTEARFSSSLKLPPTWADGLPKTTEAASNTDRPSALAKLATNSNMNGVEITRIPSNISHMGRMRIPWTWPLRNNQVPTIRSMIFYNYDRRTKGTWEYKDHKRKDQSVLADRRDEGESAVAVLEMMTETSFVSTSFVQQWHIKTHDLPDILKTRRISINGFEVHCDKCVLLSFRCAGFDMKTQRNWFRVLETDEVEVVFGTDAFERSAFGHGKSALK